MFFRIDNDEIQIEEDGMTILRRENMRAKETLSFTSLGLSVTLFATPIRRGGFQKDRLLTFPLPPPFDKFILETPVLFKFEGEGIRVRSPRQVYKIFEILKTNVNDSMPPGNSIQRVTSIKKQEKKERKPIQQEKDSEYGSDGDDSTSDYNLEDTEFFSDDDNVHNEHTNHNDHNGHIDPNDHNDDHNDPDDCTSLPIDEFDDEDDLVVDDDTFISELASVDNSSLV